MITPTDAPADRAAPAWPCIAHRAHPGDLEAANLMHNRCSLDTRYARYATPRRSITPREWSRLVHPAAGTTWLAVTPADPATTIALAHLLKTRTPGTYELAIMVEDAWQGHSIGSYLTHYALRAAAELPDCDAVTAMYAASNRRATAIVRSLNASLPTPDSGVLNVSLPLPDQSRAMIRI